MIVYNLEIGPQFPLPHMTAGNVSNIDIPGMLINHQGAEPEPEKQCSCRWARRAVADSLARARAPHSLWHAPQLFLSAVSSVLLSICVQTGRPCSAT